MATRFGMSGGLNLIYLANALLFPPILAGTAIGICNMFARVSTMLAPEVAELPDPIPTVVILVMAGAGIVLACFLI
eukprot:CAMPEP_0170543142 /NCGR_PEP_ID=MMETSP0211-20121228/2357_1 /TAXON_ID=311385 /ORGANISM="Pseudokeronopsis sp., Strain OXSARD2" /LENGTH=75 /DNA_ID=CAMNT_0010846443 /DNA_START=1331 /DNA_END=1558 /DNA_ORIENTATION=-